MAEDQDYITYISKVKLSGYKSIKDVEIEFEKGLNILIGKNSSGKSNLLDALFSAFHISKRSRKQFYWDLTFESQNENIIRWERFKNRNEIDKKEIPSEKHTTNGGINQRILINDNLVIDSEINPSRFTYKENALFAKSESLIKRIFLVEKIEIPHVAFISFNLPEKLDCLETPFSIVIEHLDAESLPAVPESLLVIENKFWEIDHEKLNPDNINEKYIENILSFDNIIKNRIKKSTPIEDFRFRKHPIIYSDENKTTIENLIIEFKVNNEWMPWSWLSDGTKRLFYIASEVAVREHGIILIEEPEIGIHPHQFHELMNWLKEEAGDKQIIISTHSPKALDYIDSNELSHIVIVNLDKEKGTQLRKLSENEIKKANKYIKEVGYLSDYWLYSDIEA